MRDFSMNFRWLFHDFPGFSMTFAVFHDYPGLEYGLPKFHDFPGPVVTLQYMMRKNILKILSCCLKFGELLFLLFDQLYSLLTSSRIFIEHCITRLQLVPTRLKLRQFLLVILQTRLHVALHHSQLQQHNQRMNNCRKIYIGKATKSGTKYKCF